MPKIDLQDLFTKKLAKFDNDEKAAEFFGVGLAKIRKWKGGTGFPEIQQCQKVLDEVTIEGVISAPTSEPSDDLMKVLGDNYVSVLDNAVKLIEAHGAINIQIVAMPGLHEVTTMPLSLDGLASVPKAEKETHLDTIGMSGNPEDAEVKLSDLGPLLAKKPAMPANPTAGNSSEFAIMLPTHRDYPQAVMFSILGNWKATLPEELRNSLAKLDGEPDTLIHVARNVLAHRFMAGEAKWSYWQDSDIIASFGNPHWFRKNAGCTYREDMLSTAAILRLRGRDKSLVGGCYSTRNGEGAIVAHPNFSNNNDSNTQLLNTVRNHGPQDRVIETPWFGFGCCLVHRSVFEAIQKLPDVPRYPDGSYGYFDPIPGVGSGPGTGQQGGEDIAFCQRAKQAGHTAFLDLSIVCGHVGRASFMPHP